MNIISFIKQCNLRSADAIILRKKFLGMVDHYAIFAGYRNNSPVFVANYKDGVKEIPYYEIETYLQTYTPESIDRFNGDENQRRMAVQRAYSRIGENNYSYVSNNCEHFKNWVHFGENYSSQVDTAANSILLASGALIAGGAATENGKAVLWGLAGLFGGLILKNMADKD